MSKHEFITRYYFIMIEIEVLKAVGGIEMSQKATLKTALESF